MPGLNPLVDKIRSTYPGAYDDMDDAALTKSVLAKYPMYSDLAAPPAAGGYATNPPQMQQVDVTGKPVNPAAASAGVPGGSSNPVPASNAYTAAVGGPLGVAAGAMGGSVALPFLKQQAVKHPVLAMMAAQQAVHQARQVPGVGKFIPAAAEWLPFLLGGGKGKEAAPDVEAASEEEAASQSPPSVSVPPTGTFQRGGPPVSPAASAPVQAPSRIPRPSVPAGAEPDIEMQMRGGVDNPPTTQIKGVPDKLGTPEQIARIRNSMESRDAAKKALESGKGDAIEKQLAGPDPYASKSAPQMESVQSTNINKVGHDGKNMWVEYKSGQVYRYKDVPEDVFNKAKDADSIGSFIARNVKGRYDTALKGTARK